MAIAHRTVYQCSCGCGKEVVVEKPHYATGACKMRAKRAGDPDSVIDVAPEPVKLRAPAPSGDPVKDAHLFVAAVKEYKSQSPYRDAPRCKHGSAAALCKHMECRP